MTTDQTYRSTERMDAEIARLRILNQTQAKLAGALAHMFDEQEAPASGTGDTRFQARPGIRQRVRRRSLSLLQTSSPTWYLPTAADQAQTGEAAHRMSGVAPVHFQTGVAAANRLSLPHR